MVRGGRGGARGKRSLRKSHLFAVGHVGRGEKKKPERGRPGSKVLPGGEKTKENKESKTGTHTYLNDRGGSTRRRKELRTLHS